MARRRKIRHPRPMPRRNHGYYWDGIQIPNTNLGASIAAPVIVDTTAQEFMPATLIRVRGHLSLKATTSTANVVRAKMMYVEVNDAQVMTGDHAPIDTHEEDIAQRQLWTHQYIQSAINTNGSVDVPIDVKAKLKLEPHGKKLLVILIEAANTTRTEFALNVRCLLRYS